MPKINRSFNHNPQAPTDPLTGRFEERENLETFKADTHTAAYLVASIDRLKIMGGLDALAPRSALRRALVAYEYALLPRQAKVLRKYLR